MSVSPERTNTSPDLHKMRPSVLWHTRYYTFYQHRYAHTHHERCTRPNRKIWRAPKSGTQDHQWLCGTHFLNTSIWMKYPYARFFTSSADERNAFDGQSRMHPHFHLTFKQLRKQHKFMYWQRNNRHAHAEHKHKGPCISFHKRLKRLKLK